MKDPIESVKNFCVIQLEILNQREERLRKEILDCKIQKEFLTSLLEDLNEKNDFHSLLNIMRSEQKWKRPLNLRACCPKDRCTAQINDWRISALIFILKKYEKTISLIVGLFFIFGAIISFYHFGIEQGFFSESFVCNLGNNNEALSSQDLLKELEKNTVSCKDVTFALLGFSLATFNTIISLVISATMLRIFINYDKNR